MARPILVVKNIENASKQYAKVAKDGPKAVRVEFGIPFALQEVIEAKPRAKSSILGVLSNGDRFNAQKLQRLKAKAADLSVTELVAAVTNSIF